MSAFSSDKLINIGFKAFLSDIKIAHSIFALPFAASVFFLCDIPNPTLWQVLWLVICMVSARSFAMGYNRYSDSEVDRQNPRTLNRAIPSRALSKNQSVMWISVFALSFVAASFQLNWLAGYLSPLLLLTLALYSKMKKWTSNAHLYLGLCLALSPIAVCIAMDFTPPFQVYLLSIGIMFWAAGFDILYALQDKDIDRKLNLRSIPAKFGVKNSIILSRVFFIVTIVCFALIGRIVNLGNIYYIGIATIAGLLIYEQYLINDSTEESVSKNLNLAFFNTNAMVSLAYFVFLVLNQLVGGT